MHMATRLRGAMLHMAKNEALGHKTQRCETKMHMAKWLRGAMHLARGSEVQEAQRCCIASTWPSSSTMKRSV